MLPLLVNWLDWFLFRCHAEYTHDIDLLWRALRLLLREFLGQRRNIYRRYRWLSLDPISNPLNHFIVDSIIAAQVNSLQGCCPGQVVANLVDNLRW